MASGCAEPSVASATSSTKVLDRVLLSTRYDFVDGTYKIAGGQSLVAASPVKPSGVVVPQHLAAGSFILVHFDMVHVDFQIVPICLDL